MKKTINTRQTQLLLLPIVEECAKKLDLTVIESDFLQENGRYFLRIFIFNLNRPVNHKDCSDLTRLIGSVLDEKDIIDVHYAIEVSSPGINRKLKNRIEFEIFKGKNVKVVIKKSALPDNTNHTILGKLEGLSEDAKTVNLIVDNNLKSVLMESIKIIQLEDEFDKKIRRD